MASGRDSARANVPQTMHQRRIRCEPALPAVHSSKPRTASVNQQAAQIEQRSEAAHFISVRQSLLGTCERSAASLQVKRTVSSNENHALIIDSDSHIHIPRGHSMSNRRDFRKGWSGRRRRSHGHPLTSYTSNSLACQSGHSHTCIWGDFPLLKVAWHSQRSDVGPWGYPSYFWVEPTELEHWRRWTAGQQLLSVRHDPVPPQSQRSVQAE